MARGSNGMKYPDPYNETGNGDPNSPEDSGGGLFVSWDEVMSAHLKGGVMDKDYSTANSNSADIMGHEAPGEPTIGGKSGSSGD